MELREMLAPIMKSLDDLWLKIEQMEQSIDRLDEFARNSLDDMWESLEELEDALGRSGISIDDEEV